MYKTFVKRTHSSAWQVLRQQNWPGRCHRKTLLMAKDRQGKQLYHPSFFDSRFQTPPPMDKMLLILARFVLFLLTLNSMLRLAFLKFWLIFWQNSNILMEKFQSYLILSLPGAWEPRRSVEATPLLFVPREQVFAYL